MPGVAVKGKDSAGGAQVQEAHHWFILQTDEDDIGDPIVTIGDRVASHGDAPHDDATMVDGEPWFLVGETPVCRFENAASCGHHTTGRYWFQLESAESGFRPYRTNPGDFCNIEHIPWIMRAKGWKVGPALMDKWFERPASREASKAQDYTSVTMGFILGYQDAHDAYKDLINPINWLVTSKQTGTTALDRLCNQLQVTGKLTAVPTAFNDFSLRPHELKQMKREIDNRVIRGERNLLSDPPKPPLDDLTAALGAFELLLVVSGDVTPLGSGLFLITVRQTAVFAEDSYDFEGTTIVRPIVTKLIPFGDWNPETHVVNPIFGDGCVANDEKFNTWRDATIASGDGRGGDTMIYTELMIEQVDPPFQFTCQM